MNASVAERFQSVLNALTDRFLEQGPDYIVAFIILTLGVLLAGVLTKIFKRTISRRSDDPLMINFLSKTFKISMTLIALMFALKTAGLGGIATSILATAGASAIIIGFAFKDVGENFISGVILSFNRPFKVNDTVSIGDIFGKVKNMEFRYTKLKTFNGRDVYIPNSDIIKKAVYNYTEDGYFRLEFVVGIAYEEEISKTEAIILEATRKVDGVFEGPQHETFITVEELGVSCVNLRVYFWVETTEYRRESHKIRSRVVEKVKIALMEAGINMPADIQELKMYDRSQSIPVQVNIKGNPSKSD